MKKELFRSVFFASILFFFGGCIAYQLTDREKEIIPFVIDFRKYADQGFLFMSDEYYGSYEVKGMIIMELHPKITYRRGKFPSGDGYYVRHFYLDGAQVTQMIDGEGIDDLINYIYIVSLSMGGDAFTHFDYKILSSQTDQHSNTTYPYYIISGMVINRLPPIQ